MSEKDWEWMRKRAREWTNENRGKCDKENDKLKGESDIRKSERIIDGKYKKKIM